MATMTRAAIIAAVLLCAAGTAWAQQPIAPPAPKEGDICIVRTGVLYCGWTVICRRWVGLNPNVKEETREPRREDDIIICDPRDSPSSQSQLWLR